MKRILILTLFPAPYRVDVFKGLQEIFEVDIFFEKNNVMGRDIKWYENLNTLNYYSLDDEEGVRQYSEAKNNLKNYDLVLLYEYSTLQACKLMFNCIAQKVNYAVNCDGAFINSNIVKTAIKKFFIKRATACFAGSKSAYDYFKYYGAKDDRIFIHNFSSIKEEEIIKEPINEKEKIDLRKELNIPYKKVVLSVGQFIYRKGYDIMLRAISLNNNKDVGYYIVGGKPSKEYLTLKDNYSLDNVHFLPFMQKEELKKYYQVSDLFVLPTREDVWGLVINEAMANGLPVITTDKCIAGVEMVKQGQNGLIYNVEDIGKLRECMNLILNQHPQDLKEMSNSSLVSAKEYTIEKIVESHINAIKSILGSTK